MTDYFNRLVAETPTRAWVNNPTENEIGLALAQACRRWSGRGPERY